MRKSIFILEDDEDIRTIITLLLDEKSYLVSTFPTAKAFKNGMIDTHPDMIILDVMLPDGNGLDICKLLKQEKDTQDIPILMMSAHTHSADIKATCGAEDFINKPFDIHDFVKRVDLQLN